MSELCSEWPCNVRLACIAESIETCTALLPAQRIQVGNFETACRMIESGVGVGVLPESAASRHAHSMDIAIVPLSDAWSVREMQICVRSLEALPSFAQELVELLVADAQGRLTLE